MSRILSVFLITAFELFIMQLEPAFGTTSSNYFETFVAPATESGDELNRNALRMERYKWPEAKVPYAFDSSYDASDRQAVLDGMLGISNETCVQFVPKSNDHVEHIKFYKSPGCGSAIGYRLNSSEPLAVTFSPFCLQLRGAIQHELLHVLGLLHEQSRPDRDDYVRIVWENIAPEYVRNFGKADWGTVDVFGLPYDFDSLMHYPGNAFAKSAQENVTMYALANPSRVLGQSTGPTFYDLEKVRRMYNC